MVDERDQLAKLAVFHFSVVMDWMLHYNLWIHSLFCFSQFGSHTARSSVLAVPPEPQGVWVRLDRKISDMFNIYDLKMVRLWRGSEQIREGKIHSHYRRIWGGKSQGTIKNAVQLNYLVNGQRNGHNRDWANHYLQRETLNHSLVELHGNDFQLRWLGTIANQAHGASLLKNYVKKMMKWDLEMQSTPAFHLLLSALCTWEKKEEHSGVSENMKDPAPRTKPYWVHPSINTLPQQPTEGWFSLCRWHQR